MKIGIKNNYQQFVLQKKDRAINDLIAQLSNYQILQSTITELMFELVNKAYKYLTPLEYNILVITETT